MLIAIFCGFKGLFVLRVLRLFSLSVNAARHFWSECLGPVGLQHITKIFFSGQSEYVFSLNLLLVEGTYLSDCWQESLKQLEQLQLATMSSDCKQERILSGKSLICLHIAVGLQVVA